jgi:hypothetical protein
MVNTYTAKTLRQFMKRIEAVAVRWESKRDGEPGLWYRGAQKSSWPLIPKLYRPVASRRVLLGKEDEIREEFVRRAPSLTAYKPENAWEWYFLMQHYAAPTRLLDWSEDPQVGLYFAVKDNEGLHDAAVWVLDPWELNDRVLHTLEVIPPGSPGLPEADILRYKPWLPDRFDAKQRLKEELPVAIYPNQFDRRIAAQRSCFTVHGLRRGSLEQLFPNVRRLLARIVIPSYATEGIRKELDDYGIDEATIYPDLEGLGKCVARWLPKTKEPPHEALFTRLGPSKIDGVGVFAIAKIKKGKLIFPADSDEMQWVPAELLPKAKSLRRLYEDFAVVKNAKDGKPKRYGCPTHFTRLTMSWYINDPLKGEEPNVECDEDYDFRAVRDIRKGEELTVDSSKYSQHLDFRHAKSTKAVK